jgi:hypothetical protein
MNRRSFIRLVGGGVALAALGGTSGCSDRYPAEAVAPWGGPGDEPDLRRWALGYAILAPSSHNRQPWIADLREPDALTLHVDRERLLPMTDPWFRQIVVSQGTFLEALVLALRERGIAPEVRLFPEGEFAPRETDERPVARILWRRGAPAPAKDPLFAQLLRRNTAKVEYDTTRPVAPGTLELLGTALADPDVRHAGTVDAGRVAELRALCEEAARVEVRTPRTVLESLRLFRVGPAEIARHRDGISLNSTLPRLGARLGLFDREHAPAEGSRGFKQLMSVFEAHARTAMGFVWLSTPAARDLPAGTTRSAEVRAGRAYLRLQLRATELGLQVHPLSQATQEFPEMQSLHDRLHRLLLGKPASEETVQMLCRVGYCAEQQHAPRRGVDAIVRG